MAGSGALALGRTSVKVRGRSNCPNSLDHEGFCCRPPILDDKSAGYPGRHGFGPLSAGCVQHGQGLTALNGLAHGRLELDARRRVDSLIGAGAPGTQLHGRET
jgi:hypothetical protein